MVQSPRVAFFTPSRRRRHRHHHRHRRRRRRRRRRRLRRRRRQRHLRPCRQKMGAHCIHVRTIIPLEIAWSLSS